VEKFYARKTIVPYVFQAPISTVVSAVVAAMPVPRPSAESTYGCAGVKEARRGRRRGKGRRG